MSDKTMDLMYVGDTASKDEFKAALSKAFPGMEMDEEWDEIHEWRVSIYYEPEAMDAVMTWMVKEGWIRSSFNFNLMIHDPKEHKRIRKWVDAGKEMEADGAT